MKAGHGRVRRQRTSTLISHATDDTWSVGSWQAFADREEVGGGNGKWREDQRSQKLIDTDTHKLGRSNAKCRRDFVSSTVDADLEIVGPGVQTSQALRPLEQTPRRRGYLTGDGREKIV